MSINAQVRIAGEVNMSSNGFDFVLDTPDQLAVFSNGNTVAERLRYDDVSQVMIEKLIVAHDTVTVLEEAVVQGKYLSAIFVEAWMAYRGKGRREIDWIEFDDVAMMALEGYVGEQIWRDAGDPGLDNHGFVRAVRAGKGKKVVVMVQWKSKQPSELNQVGNEI